MFTMSQVILYYYNNLHYFILPSLFSAVTSSHSALTTVTADDFDSDISDITELK